MFIKYSINTAHIQTQPISADQSSQVSTTILLSMFNKYTLFPVHVHGVRHCRYPWPDRMPQILSSASHYTIHHAHVQSVHHLYCPCSVSTPTINTNFCPYPGCTPRFRSKLSQYTISSGEIQSEHHLSCPSQVSTPYLIYPNSVRTPPLLYMSKHYTCIYWPSGPCSVSLNKLPNT